MFFVLPYEYVSALAAAGKLCDKNSAIFTGSSKQTATDKSVSGLGWSHYNEHALFHLTIYGGTLLAFYRR